MTIKNSQEPPAPPAEVVPPEPDLLATAPALTRLPYRWFFPLGFLLAWAGVLHWFLRAVGVLEEGHPIYHSIAQIQGFMMSFAAGFIYTMVPRRTGTAAPAVWQVILTLCAPVAICVCAWFELWSLSQVLWLAMMIGLIAFAVRRFRSKTARRRPPHAFLWIPAGLLMGVAGSLCTGVYGIVLGVSGESYYHLHEIGKLLLVQGMFLALILGVGSIVFPLFTCGDAPPDAPAGKPLGYVGHLLGVLALVLTFFLESYGFRTFANGARGGIVLLVLLVSCRIYRLPRLPGLNRWLVWLAAWVIPLGCGLAAAFPAQHQQRVAMHVVYIGGFAGLAFAVGLHVALAHGGRKPILEGRPWQVLAFAVLFLSALICRGLTLFDLESYSLWLGLSSASFLLGSLAWAALAMPSLLVWGGAEAGQGQQG